MMRIGTVVLLTIILLILWNRLGPNMVDTSEVDFSEAIVIDVRSPGEFSGGHVDGAINLPIDTITEDELRKTTQPEQTIVLYCHSGGRAAIVKKRMETWGFTNVYNLKTQAQVTKTLN